MAEIIEVNDPWAVKFRKELKILCVEKSNAICAQIAKIGMGPDLIIKWTQLFLNEMIDLFDNMQNDIQEEENKVSTKIIELLEKIESICKILGVAMPSYGSEYHPLFQEKDILESHIKMLEKMLMEKRKVLISMSEKEIPLCYYLGISPKINVQGQVPTEKEMKQYWIYLEELERTKYKRSKEYNFIKERLLNIQKQVQSCPIELEKHLSISNNNFIASDKNMCELKMYLERMEKKLEDTNAEVEKLISRLKSLWVILEENPNEITNIINNLPSAAIDKIEALSINIQKCGIKMNAMLEKIIQKLRDQLMDLWNKCRYSTDLRNEFSYINDTHYTEDLKNRHDLEISHLQTYYEQNKDIFLLVEKYDKLSEKKLNYEKSASSRDRFKNRGGKLMQEIKENNVVTKQLEQLENKLHKVCYEYTKRTNKMLFIDGYTIEDYISNKHEDINRVKNSKADTTLSKQVFNSTFTIKRNMNQTISTESVKKNQPRTAIKKQQEKTYNSPRG